jgi:hypothetical protein
MSVPNLPEDLLYRKIPVGILNEDTRLLLRAVVGGFQDKVSELRALAGQISELWRPDNSVGEPFQVVVVTYTDAETSEVRQVTLNVNDLTPSVDSADFISWCASEANLQADQISSTELTTSTARTAEIRTLSLLAETFGTRLYPDLSTDSAEIIANQKRTLKTYFSRLKVKGTALSFELLGKLHGFNDVLFVPLWGRVSPRIPNSIGSTLNDVDFAAQPQGIPTPGQITDIYDPNVLNDGDIYIWTSEAFGISPSQTDYLVNVISGVNPYIEVVITAATQTLPAAGSYVLGGGDNGVKATTAEPLNEVGVGCGFKFVAIAPGRSFNGAQILISAVDATHATVTVYHNLSSVKFRTSYFNLAAATEIVNYATHNTSFAPVSTDLKNDPALWQRLSADFAAGAVPFANDGVALDPYRYWTGGGGEAFMPTVVTWPDLTYTPSGLVPDERVQALIDTPALNLEALQGGSQRLLGNIDDIRPATRFLRSFRYGLSFETQTIYAPHISKELLYDLTLAIVLGSPVTHTGSNGTADVNFPTGDYVGRFKVDVTIQTYVDSGSGFVLTNTQTTEYDVASESRPATPTISDLAFAHPVNVNLLHFTGVVDVNANTWSLTFIKAGYQVTDGGITTKYVISSAAVYAFWECLSTELIRAEPPADDAVRHYQPRPEDEFETTYQYGLTEKNVWGRDILAGGEVVSRDGERSNNLDLKITYVSSYCQVIDEQQKLYSVLGIDRPDDIGYAVLRPAEVDDGQRAIGFKLPSVVGNQSGQTQHAGALSTVLPAVLGTAYVVGAVRGILVADLEAHWKPAQRDGLVAWFHLGEHPAQPYLLRDHSDLELTSTEIEAGVFTSNYALSDRRWDTTRGWMLLLRGGEIPSFFQVQKSRVVGSNFAICFWAKSDPGLVLMDELEIFSFGPITIKMGVTYSNNPYLQTYAQDLDGVLQPLGSQVALNSTAPAFYSLSVAELIPPTPILADVCSTENATRLGLPVIDEVQTKPGMKILLTGQTDATENGYYIADEAGWIRAATLTSFDETQAYYQVLQGSHRGYYQCTNIVAITYGADAVSYEQQNIAWYGSIGGPGTGLMRSFSTDDTLLRAGGPAKLGAPGIFLSDLRVWSMTKSSEDLTTIQVPPIRSTAVACRPTFFASSSGALKGLQVLNGGYAFSNVRPLDFYVERLAKKYRYRGDGTFTGSPGERQVGFGDDKYVTGPVALGLTRPYFKADGTSIAASTSSNLPGWNALWPTVSAAEFQNPGRDFIFVKGEDGNFYQVNLKNSLTDNAGLAAATPVSFQAQLAERVGPLPIEPPTTSAFEPEFLSDAEARLETSGVGRLAVQIVSGEPTVTRLADTGKNTPPLYLYVHGDDYIDYQLNADLSTWVNQEQAGIDLGLPLRSLAGPLTIAGGHLTLPAGRYKLVLDTSLVGSVPVNFAGANVEVSVTAQPDFSLNSSIYQATLLKSGNPSYSVRYGAKTAERRAANSSVVEFQEALDELATETGGVTVLTPSSLIGGPYYVQFNAVGARNLLEFLTYADLDVEVRRTVSGNGGTQEVQKITFNRPLVEVDLELEQDVLFDGSHSWNVQVYLTSPSSTQAWSLVLHALKLTQYNTSFYRISPGLSSLTITAVDIVNSLNPATKPGGFEMEADDQGILTYSHEGKIRALSEIPGDTQDDSKLTAATLLCGSTVERRQSLIIETTYTPPDPASEAPIAAPTLHVYVDDGSAWNPDTPALLEI